MYLSEYYHVVKISFIRKMIKCIFVVANELIMGDEYHGRNIENDCHEGDMTVLRYNDNFTGLNLDVSYQSKTK